MFVHTRMTAVSNRMNQNSIEDRQKEDLEKIISVEMKKRKFIKNEK